MRSREMLQPTNESAGLASGPHPLTQRINEDQAILEFPGEFSWDTTTLLLYTPLLWMYIHSTYSLSLSCAFRVRVLRLAAEHGYSPSHELLWKR